MKLFTTLLLLISLGTFGQSRHRFPIWSFHQDSVTIDGLSFGLVTFGDDGLFSKTTGVKVELGLGILVPLIPRSPIVTSEPAYNSLPLITNKVNGLYIGGTGAVCECKTNGILLGMIGQIVREVNGISACLMLNLAQRHDGVQLAFFTNQTYITRGVQFSISNATQDLKGIQIGLFNKTNSIKGLQIGLWNINDKRKLPIINW